MNLLGEIEVRKTLLDGGGEMAFVETGEGPSILLVHGSLCDFRYWTPQMTPLATGHRCVAPSLTFYWPNSPTPPGAPFGWREHVREIAEFIGGHCGGKAHVVGHSRGGHLVYQLALAFPQLVHSIVLADPAGAVRNVDRPEAALPESVTALRREAADLIESGRREEGLRLFVDSVSLPGSWDKSTASFKTMALDNAHTLPLQFGDPLPAYDADQASRIQCPTLLIDGERSPRIFRMAADALGRWIPGNRRVTMRSVSHGMNTAHPSAFNKLVLDFVRGSTTP